MTEEVANKVVELKFELETLESLKRTMETEDAHWWKFKTPDELEGIRFPTSIRKGLKEMVCSRIDEIHKTIGLL